MSELDLLARNPALKQLEVQAAEAMRLNRKLLYDTAHGGCYVVKAGEFWFEVLSGVFMILSLLTIWFFCPERRIDFEESLPAMSKRELRSQGYSGECAGHGFGPDPGADEEDG